jgi:pimeloyl-ACP methyl ester carboxylesterase
MPYTKNKGVRIYWEEQGEGDPLLMIMGLSLSMALWGELRGIMARHFRVIVIDNRCVGKSDAPNFPFTVETMAHDAACVLDDAGVQKTHVFGVSMGGMIAQQFAISYPARVDKLILGCTSCDGPQAVWAESSALRLMRFPFISKEARVRALVPFLYHPKTPRESVDRHVELLHANAPSLIASMKQVASMMSWRCCEQLPQITSETLVIHGEDDRIIPVDRAKLIAERVPRGELAIIPNAGHIFPADQLEVTTAVLLGFLMRAPVTN